MLCKTYGMTNMITYFHGSNEPETRGPPHLYDKSSWEWGAMTMPSGALFSLSDEELLTAFCSGLQSSPRAGFVMRFVPRWEDVGNPPAVWSSGWWSKGDGAGEARRDFVDLLR